MALSCRTRQKRTDLLLDIKMEAALLLVACDINLKQKKIFSILYILPVLLIVPRSTTLWKWFFSNLIKYYLGKTRVGKTYIRYSGHKSCVSQDSRLYLARLFSQDLNCKTCKTKIHKKNSIFQAKNGAFSKNSANESRKKIF